MNQLDVLVRPLVLSREMHRRHVTSRFESSEVSAVDSNGRREADEVAGHMRQDEASALQCQDCAALATLRQEIAEARRLREPDSLARGLLGMARIALRWGEPRAARLLLDRASTSADDNELLAQIGLHRGLTFLTMGRLDDAQATLTPLCSAGRSQLGQEAWLRASAYLGAVWYRQGRQADGLELITRSVDEAIRAGATSAEGQALSLLACGALAQGQLARARQLFGRALDVTAGNLGEVVALPELPWLRQLCPPTGDTTWQPTGHRDDAGPVGCVDRGRLDLLQFAIALRDGSDLGVDAWPHSDAPARLNFTHSEREILQHLADGLTTRQIASLRGRAPNTVRNQVATLLSKLEVTTRAAAVAKAAQLGLEFVSR